LPDVSGTLCLFIYMLQPLWKSVSGNISKRYSHSFYNFYYYIGIRYLRFCHFKLFIYPLDYQAVRCKYVMASCDNSEREDADTKERAKGSSRQSLSFQFVKVDFPCRRLWNRGCYSEM
jgi:hypothetical protein